MARLRRVGMIGAAVAFVRSQQGQQMITQARQRFDTPQNREKLRQTVSGLTNRRRGR